MAIPRYVPVEGNPNLVRDMKSKAIINTNAEALQAYKKARAHRQRLDSMMDEFEEMKSDLSDIKNLLKALVEKGA